MTVLGWLVLSQPVDGRFRCPLQKEIDDALRFHVNDDGPRAVTTPQGKLVDAQHRWRAGRWRREVADHTEEGAATDREATSYGEARTRSYTDREAHLSQDGLERNAAPCRTIRFSLYGLPKGEGQEGKGLGEL